MLYTLNLYSVLCQWYLNKTGKMQKEIQLHTVNISLFIRIIMYNLAVYYTWS